MRSGRKGMLEKIKNWIQGAGSSKQSTPAQNLQQSGAHPRPTQSPRDRDKGAERRKILDRRTQPGFVDLDPTVAGNIESNGPGKNVLIRNKYQREDTGTHETLRIVVESLLDSDEETGIDPYNTGNFDRSKNWDKRFRKK